MQRSSRLHRPLYYASLCAFTLTLLTIDALYPSLWVQLVLGLAAFALLLSIARKHPVMEQREMWFTVVVSTMIELFGTQFWGLYGYQLGNVPFYVLPGHGLIAIVCAGVPRTAFMQRHGQKFVYAVLAVSGLWTLGGLTLYPLVTGRFDVHGALYWPFFASILLFTPKAQIYAWTFVIASLIELVGTALGLWHWSPVMPGLGLPSSAVPSAVAGGYCFFAVVGGWLAEATQRRLPVAWPKLRDAEAAPAMLP